jgi:hypothetical protein
MQLLRWLFRLFDPDYDLVVQAAAGLLSIHGGSVGEAIRFSKQMIRDAHAASRKGGTSSLPVNYGDVLLEKERTDPEIAEQLKWKRSEGVVDDDIRQWWNQPDHHRWLFRLTDEWQSYLHASVLHTQQGLSPAEAASEMFRMYPSYDDQPVVLNKTARPFVALPWELMFRIIEYARRCGSREEMDRRRAGVTIMNEFVRGEIRSGRL